MKKNSCLTFHMRFFRTGPARPSAPSRLRQRHPADGRHHLRPRRDNLLGPRRVLLRNQVYKKHKKGKKKRHDKLKTMVKAFLFN